MERRDSVNAIKELAYNACRMTSFDPEVRGEQLLDSLESELQLFLKQLPEEVREDYEARYIEKYCSWLSAKGRCFSVMITGAGGFNTRRHEKTNKAEMAARCRLDDWSQKVINRFNGHQRLTGWDEVERLQIKHDKLVEKQNMMKETNKILRAKKMTELEKWDELVAIGWFESQIPKLFEPDCYGCVGFESFTLTNNNAEIKRLEGQIAVKTRNLQKEDFTTEYEWGSVEFCYSEERIRIRFNDMPSSDVREILKHNAYKWSRNNDAWQRQITPNATFNFNHTLFHQLEEKMKTK